MNRLPDIKNLNLKLLISLLIIFASPSKSLFAQQNLSKFETKFDDDLNDKVLFLPRDIQWVEELKSFIYREFTKEGEKAVSFDPYTLERRELWNIDRLVPFENKFGLETTKKLSYEAPKTLILEGQDNIWKFDLESKTIKKGKKKKLTPWDRSPFGAKYFAKEDSVVSPDKKYVAFVRDHNVFVKDDNDRSLQLSYDGTEGGFYTTKDMLWSPDSKKLFVQKVKPGSDRKIYMIESSPSSRLEPILHSLEYLKPGDALPQINPTIFLVEKGLQINVNRNKIIDQYALSHFKWRKDSNTLVFEYNKRGHQTYQLIGMDALTGDIEVIIDERSDTFLFYGNGFGKRFRYDISDGEEIIWASERDGWNHLYLYDAQGKVKNQITKGDWVVRKVIHVDEKNRTILFEGSGFNSTQDPYFLQLFQVNFDGSGLKQLTTENANHQMFFNDDFSLFIDVYSRVDKIPIIALRRVNDGKIIKKIQEADASGLFNMGWKFPEVFSTKGRDGETDIWGIMVKPSDFNPKKKYPLIELIYAGPHDSHVPKNFVTNHRVDMFGLAELGFIVVQIDGMGTSNRSKKFHDVAYKNLKDAGFPDRIIWIKELAKRNPYIDISKVGIYGRSAGGQNAAAALIFHPEFYKVAVATAGNFDNRMDKLWWNEQWMGYPIDKQYKKSSDTENAARLEGDLMIQLSELDTNVDPSSTHQFIDALIKAGKTFEFVFMPGEDHQAQGDYGILKRREFFDRKIIP